jgi:L-aspartate oxidase
MMGGIVTDLHGASTLPGLYAVGESSCTGLHGANRLASNSLSECFVFARRAVEHALGAPASASASVREREIEALGAAGGPPVADRSTRDALWRDAGIVRTPEGLQRLLSSTHSLVRLIARCALERAESRGAHQRIDHPARDPALDHRHVVVGADETTAWQTWT